MNMNSFRIRLWNLILIIGIIVAYHMVLKSRQQEDELARLTAQVESFQLSSEQTSEGTAEAASNTTSDTTSGETVEEGIYADGTYTGEAQGFGGIIEVEVMIENGSISAISILSSEGEDGAYFSMAEDIIPSIIEAQNADVDTISGATFSSTGIKDAVALALEEAKL